MVIVSQTRAVSEDSAQSGSMTVEVAHLGRKSFENVGAVDGAEIDDSVRPHSAILSIQSIDSYSSDDRACEHYQSQWDRSVHGIHDLVV